MKTLALRLCLVALPLSASLLATADARACGGCFHPENQPPEKVSVVTAHRMAISISPDVSVLWDQVQYAGSPDEFAWVLPVKPGSTIEVASDAWFEALDAATTTQIVPPTIQCVTTTTTPGTPGTPGFRGCQMGGAGMAMGCAAGEPGSPGTPPEDITEINQHVPPQEPVTVVHEGSAGPYETVTLHANVPGAANMWLTQHNYAIGADIQPILDAYAADGFDFIALRLLPDKGVQQMKPVRVLQPGAVTTLPLRMVAAGTGASVGLTLFVVSEGRYYASNFAEIVRPSAVTWDFAVQKSDYAEQLAARSNVGPAGGWLTSYALPGGLFSRQTIPPNNMTVQYTTGFGSAGTIADAFMQQAYANKETQISCSGIFNMLSNSGDKVVDLCPPGGGQCADPMAGELDSRYFECGPLRDLAVALVGQHPKDVWVTRLEANLPREALAQDLVLAASDQQEPLSNYIVAQTFENAPCQVAGAATPTMRAGGGRRAGGARVFLFLTSAALLAAAVARRLGRSRVPSPVPGR